MGTVIGRFSSDLLISNLVHRRHKKFSQLIKSSFVWTMTAKATTTTSASTMGQEEQIRKQKRLEDLEAKAVAEASATADAAYTPSATLLNAATAEPLLKQVDGPSLEDYEGKLMPDLSEKVRAVEETNKNLNDELKKAFNNQQQAENMGDVPSLPLLSMPRKKNITLY